MLVLLSSKSLKKRISEEFEELVRDVNKLSQPVDNDERGEGDQ
jgi:hypothetical protein